MKPFETRFTEVDDIRFETLVSEQVLTIPPKEFDAYTLVEFGIRVTNLSPLPYRFIFFYLVPEIVTADGNQLKKGGGINPNFSPYRSEFVWLSLGDSVTSSLQCKLFWILEEYMPNKRNKNQLGARDSLVLRGLNNFGHEWIFLDLSPNPYLVRFPYPQVASEEKLGNINKTVDGLWAGKVSTPWTKFSLIIP
ncbi:MAG: hypothetical protein WBA93_16965 [Microcoleaceae cyanobacterium]